MSLDSVGSESACERMVKVVVVVGVACVVWVGGCGFQTHKVSEVQTKVSY